MEKQHKYVTFQLFRVKRQGAFFLFQALGGCISGSIKVVSQIRTLHHVLGGTLNPVSDFYRAEPPWKDILICYCG